MILQQPSGLNYIPKRIVSLVPSQTELLYHLGLEGETTGITKFCVHPLPWFKTKTRVGGTKTINIDIIKQLQPDLIIANKEENVKEQIEQLAVTYNVWLTDVNNFDEALAMIKDIAGLTAKEKEADLLIKEINTVFDQLTHITQNPKPRPTGSSGRAQTAYLIWRNPYMAVGGDTFINDMLLKCGMVNVFAYKTRYPEVSITDLQTANCQLLLLSSEPYPFKQKHIEELSAQLPGVKIILADGEFFSWYGSRMLQAAVYFNNLISSL